MLIIPAIDLRGGLCVRLFQGDYGKETVYSEDPVEVAQEFEQHGAELLHVVDLDGAKSGMQENLPVIRRIARAVKMKLEVGGGVRSLDSIQALLDAGVDRAVVGTKLVEDPELAALMFSTFPGRVVAGIDARHGMMATDGWTEQSTVRAAELARRIELLGACRIILTDIARDGTLSGPNLELLVEVTKAVNIPIIQSGGVGTLDDIRSIAACETPPEGVIVGRAIYEGRMSVKEAIQVLTS